MYTIYCLLSCQGCLQYPHSPLTTWEVVRYIPYYLSGWESCCLCPYIPVLSWKVPGIQYYPGFVQVANCLLYLSPSLCPGDKLPSTVHFPSLRRQVYSLFTCLLGKLLSRSKSAQLSTVPGEPLGMSTSSWRLIPPPNSRPSLLSSRAVRIFQPDVPAFQAPAAELAIFVLFCNTYTH